MEKSEFHVLIKHYFLIGEKNTVQAKQQLDKCYSDCAPSKMMDKRWYADFKCGHTDTNDAKFSGCLNLAVVPENTKKNLNKLLADHKLKLCDIVEELKILKSSVLTILHEHLSMRKLCSKWVQRLYTVNQKQRVDDSVLFATVSMQQKSFCVNQLKTQASVGKVLASIFQGAQGILFIDYLEKGRTISNKHYIALLMRLKEEITKKMATKEEKSALSPRQYTVTSQLQL